MLLNSCRRARVLFGIGRHRDRLNILQPAEARALAPIQELADGMIVSDPRVLVADGNGKKFEVSLGRHLLGFSYAPRFKNLKRQRLYIFKSHRGLDRSVWKIKPTGYIDDELAIQHWDDILRLIATIKLKEVTASDLFRRLNSYSKQHALYHALKAFGQITKSLFILRLIDDPALRQAIEKQLDRIEHVHRFTRAVSVGNPREFLQAEKEEQEMAEACKRLIKNCIICWNYLYLSQKLEDSEDTASREAFLEAVANGSAVSWQHINLLGEYDFSDEKLQDTVGIKAPKLADQRDTFLGVAKEQNSKAGTALDKILFRIWYLCWNLTRVEAWGG
jgi:hypothetical protein